MYACGALSVWCAGQPQQALESAEAALRLLGCPSEELEGECQPLLAKALHRKAQALVGLGAVVAAVRVYRQGLAVCTGHKEELLGALRVTTDLLPCSWLAKVGGTATLLLLPVPRTVEWPAGWLAHPAGGLCTVHAGLRFPDPCGGRHHL